MTIIEEKMFDFHERPNIVLEGKNDRMLAHMEMSKDQMFKLNL